MLVDLRDMLPPGFTPDDVNRRLLSGAGPSLEGLHVLGDPENVLGDVDRAIRHIRERLIETPNLNQVTAEQLAAALPIPPHRAERALALISSAGAFSTGGSGSTHGMSMISLGRDDVLAAYLSFESIGLLLSKRAAAATQDAPVAQRSGRPDVVPDSAFILMNMDASDPTLTDVANAIKEECRSFGVSATRVDDIEHSDRITDRILERLRSAEFIIADLTGERPNVYYEVGFAHALGKRPILYRRVGTRLHFDLSIHNVPEYVNLTQLREFLRKRLEAMLGRSPAAAG
ncbi:MAG: hypothetical protein AB7L66_13820 [Gemmatimonadales bacterium]